MSRNSLAAGAGLLLVAGSLPFLGAAPRFVFTNDGLTLDGTTWDGQLQTGPGVFLNGDPWTDVLQGLQGDPWTDTFTWPGGYPWEDRSWSLVLEETMSINVWVQQQ